jgi:hypothetical protein
LNVAPTLQIKEVLDYVQEHFPEKRPLVVRPTPLDWALDWAPDSFLQLGLSCGWLHVPLYSTLPS